MTTKKSTDRALELREQLEQADLAERQGNDMALLKADEAARLAGYTEERDLMNQLLGQVQMARSLAKFTDVVGLSKLAHIKENKLYLALKGKSGVDAEGNEITDVGTWAGFCRAIGSSDTKIDEDLRNLRVFGEDAMNGLNRIGAGYRELRKLRALPEEDRDLIINGEAVKAGDKESLVELIDELAAKHAKEKQRLEAKVQDLEANLEVSHRLGKEKTQKIDELAAQLQKRDLLPTEERAAELSQRLDQAIRDATRGLNEPSRVFAEILGWDDAPRELRHACAQGIARLRVALDSIQQQYKLPSLDLDVDDSWMQEVGALS